MIICNSSFIHINNIIMRGLCTFKVLFIIIIILFHGFQNAIVILSRRNVLAQYNSIGYTLDIR